MQVRYPFIWLLLTSWWLKGPSVKAGLKHWCQFLTFSGSLIHEADLFSLSSCWKIFSYIVWQNQSILVTSPNQFSPLLIRPGYLHQPHSLHYSRTWFQRVSGNGMYCPKIQRRYLSYSHLSRAWPAFGWRNQRPCHIHQALHFHTFAFFIHHSHCLFEFTWLQAEVNFSLKFYFEYIIMILPRWKTLCDWRV